MVPLRPWPNVQNSFDNFWHFLEILVCYFVKTSTVWMMTIKQTYLYLVFSRDPKNYTKPHVYIVCYTYNKPSYFVVWYVFSKYVWHTSNLGWAAGEKSKHSLNSLLNENNTSIWSFIFSLTVNKKIKRLPKDAYRHLECLFPASGTGILGDSPFNLRPSSLVSPTPVCTECNGHPPPSILGWLVFCPWTIYGWSHNRLPILFSIRFLKILCRNDSGSVLAASLKRIDIFDVNSTVL